MPERTNFQKLRDLIYFNISGFYNIKGIKFYDFPDIGEWKRLLILNNLSTEVIADDFKLNISEKDINKNYLKFNLNKEFRLVISIGSKMWGQILHPIYWIKLLNQLHEETSIKVVFIGNKKDWELTEYIANRSKIKSINLCGETSINESFSILNKVGRYFGYDSGPMHLAVSAGCKLVAIFSDQSPINKWYPFGNENNIIRISSDLKNIIKDHDINKTEYEKIWIKLIKILNY